MRGNPCRSAEPPTKAISASTSNRRITCHLFTLAPRLPQDSRLRSTLMAASPWEDSIRNCKLVKLRQPDRGKGLKHLQRRHQTLVPMLQNPHLTGTTSERAILNPHRRQSNEKSKVSQPSTPARAHLGFVASEARDGEAVADRQTASHRSAPTFFLFPRLIPVCTLLGS